MFDHPWPLFTCSRLKLTTLPCRLTLTPWLFGRLVLDEDSPCSAHEAQKRPQKRERVRCENNKEAEPHCDPLRPGACCAHSLLFDSFQLAVCHDCCVCCWCSWCCSSGHESASRCCACGHCAPWAARHALGTADAAGAVPSGRRVLDISTKRASGAALCAQAAVCAARAVHDDGACHCAGGGQRHGGQQAVPQRRTTTDEAGGQGGLLGIFCGCSALQRARAERRARGTGRLCGWTTEEQRGRGRAGTRQTCPVPTAPVLRPRCRPARRAGGQVLLALSLQTSRKCTQPRTACRQSRCALERRCAATRRRQGARRMHRQATRVPPHALKSQRPQWPRLAQTQQPVLVR